jgi:hypothetical protein
VLDSCSHEPAATIALETRQPGALLRRPWTTRLATRHVERVHAQLAPGARPTTRPVTTVSRTHGSPPSHPSHRGRAVGLARTLALCCALRRTSLNRARTREHSAQAGCTATRPNAAARASSSSRSVTCSRARRGCRRTSRRRSRARPARCPGRRGTGKPRPKRPPKPAREQAAARVDRDPPRGARSARLPARLRSFTVPQMGVG